MTPACFFMVKITGSSPVSVNPNLSAKDLLKSPIVVVPVLMQFFRNIPTPMGAGTIFCDSIRCFDVRPNTPSSTRS